ncbi:hypothetical protein D3C75_789330 [compost metagenome]
MIKALEDLVLSYSTMFKLTGKKVDLILIKKDKEFELEYVYSYKGISLRMQVREAIFIYYNEYTKKINVKIRFNNMGISDTDGKWIYRKHLVWKNAHSELEDYQGKYWFFQFTNVEQLQEIFNIIEIDTEGI